MTYMHDALHIRRAHLRERASKRASERASERMRAKRARAETVHSPCPVPWCRHPCTTPHRTRGVYRHLIHTHPGSEALSGLVRRAARQRRAYAGRAEAIALAMTSALEAYVRDNPQIYALYGPPASVAAILGAGHGRRPITAAEWSVLVSAAPAAPPPLCATAPCRGADAWAYRPCAMVGEFQNQVPSVGYTDDPLRGTTARGDDDDEYDDDDDVGSGDGLDTEVYDDIAGVDSGGDTSA
jgi:hypothetical protein